MQLISMQRHALGRFAEDKLPSPAFNELIEYVTIPPENNSHSTKNGYPSLQAYLDIGSRDQPENEVAVHNGAPVKLKAAKTPLVKQNYTPICR